MFTSFFLAKVTNHKIVRFLTVPVFTHFKIFGCLIHILFKTTSNSWLLHMPNSSSHMSSLSLTITIQYFQEFLLILPHPVSHQHDRTQPLTQVACRGILASVRRLLHLEVYPRQLLGDMKSHVLRDSVLACYQICMVVWGLDLRSHLQYY